VQASAVNFLPGPVALRREVRRAFEQAPESHRAESFLKDFQAAARSLCELTQARRVQFFMGSGTLGNDVVGAQLSLSSGKGLVLSNGEFGERLADHARRHRLDFEHLAVPWGSALNLETVRARIEQARPGWLWLAHCETSTGVLNPLESLKELCAEFHVELCLDCISSIGTVPVDLRGVRLASCSSGKGLRSYAGISMVFHNDEVAPAPDRLPRYLDLGYAAQSEGVPFTFSSNLLHALHAAVKRVDWPRHFEELRDTSAWLRTRLGEAGFNLIGVGKDAIPAPAIVTLALPEELSSQKVGAAMQDAGYLLSCNSDYLRRRNWIQVCIMGESSREKLAAMLSSLKRVCVKSAAVSKSVGSP
jgi:aspartate aminotransferase-like enzyme